MLLSITYDTFYLLKSIDIYFIETIYWKTIFKRNSRIIILYKLLERGILQAWSITFLSMFSCYFKAYSFPYSVKPIKCFRNLFLFTIFLDNAQFFSIPLASGTLDALFDFFFEFYVTRYLIASYIFRIIWRGHTYPEKLFRNFYNAS